MHLKWKPLALAAMLAVTATTAHAGSANFKSPSGNIFCGYFDYDGPTEVRCDMRNFTPSMGKQPADCDLDWGDAFSVNAQSNRGSAVCHGDTVISPDARILPYGKSFAQGGIVCLSDTHGITCTNGKGHGFFVSKAQQRVF